MSDQSALVRQWMLLKLLGARNGAVTVGDLANEMEVSQKTIRRDLVTFRTVGFPIEETTRDHGRKAYRLDSNWGKHELSFTFDEAFAMYVG